MNAWDNDQDFEKLELLEVKPTKKGYEISSEQGLWMFIECPDFEPKAGMEILYFPKGTFASKRGIIIDGKCVYYRTEAEEKVFREEQTYGKDCEEYLRRWDNGDLVWTIEMGGMGPGYEQAIQVSAMEVLRYFVKNQPDLTDEKVLETIDKDLSAAIMPILDELGLSGAQWGAAKNIASVLYRNGPIKALEMPEVQDRKIMVSKNFPQIKSAA